MFGSGAFAQVSSSFAVVSGIRWWERMGAAFLVTALTASSTQDLEPSNVLLVTGFAGPVTG